MAAKKKEPAPNMDQPPRTWAEAEKALGAMPARIKYPELYSEFYRPKPKV